MGTLFLVVVDIVLFLIFVLAGGFPGFAIWVVLSVVVFYANHLLHLKRAELVLKAESKQASLMLKSERVARKRRSVAQPKRLSAPSPSDDDESDPEVDAPNFVKCAECDAKNNAKRETCWQCKNPLRVDAREALRKQRPKRKRIVDTPANVPTSDVLGMPVCKHCSSLNDADATHCDACGRKL